MELNACEAKDTYLNMMLAKYRPRSIKNKSCYKGFLFFFEIVTFKVLDMIFWGGKAKCLPKYIHNV